MKRTPYMRTKMLHDYAKQEWRESPVFVDGDKLERWLNYACAFIALAGLAFIGWHVVARLSQ